ncbi:hypothetical protein AX16_000935 [Volvariella volvacea WC 439]|nr:hypothetical protein AX16_000935 [Volvariella volvacea WC 439]
MFHTAWTQLAEKFGTPNAVIVFGDFRKAMNFRISGNNNPETMMLLAAIPQKWDNVSMTLLVQYDMDGLIFDIINAAIIAKYNQKSNISNGIPQAKKISAVKRKEGDPKWKEQKSSGDSDKKSNKHGKRSGKHRNKGDKKENKDNSHSHAHSHLASAVHVLYTFPNSTPTTTSSEIISPAAHSLLECIHDAPAQVYTGQCHHHSVFPIVNAACTLAERMDIMPTMQTLSNLEMMLANSATLKDKDEVSRPTKRKRQMYEYTTSDEECDEKQEIFGLSEHSSNYDSDDVVLIGYESDPNAMYAN